MAEVTLDGTPMNVTMSNGNLTVTRNSGSGATGVYSTSKYTTGKYYFEFIIQNTITTNTLIGIAPEGTIVFNLDTTGIVVAIGASSSVLNNGTPSGKTIGSVALNDIFAMAMDLGARLAWFRRQNGNWNGDGAANPSTGTGGVSFAATVPFSPYIKFAAGLNNPDAITMNFGASAFFGAVPSTFTSWGDAPPPLLLPSLGGYTGGGASRGRMIRQLAPKPKRKREGAATPPTSIGRQRY
jgi:hypothetical protein